MQVLSRETKIIPVILCGGVGSRLWPVSRDGLPKQFIGFGSDPKASLLAETLGRLKALSRLEAPVVVAAEEQRFPVAEHLRAAGFPQAEIILEPMGRNTAPAVAAAALAAQASHGDDALLLVVPSDHIIRDEAAFVQGVETAVQAALAGHLVTFGILPDYAETGYGYIRRGEALGIEGTRRIARFVEKPDAETAECYLASGEYYWNSGMFLFPLKALLDDMGSFCPDITEYAGKALVLGEKSRDFTRLEAEAFASCPAVSIDYALMELTSKGAVVPLACGWSDAGSWDALWRIAEKDGDANVLRGAAYAHDARNSYLRQHGGPPITALGVEGLVVVSTRDMVLVAERGRSQEIGRLMECASAEAAAVS